jgi:GT2 family glycosyltransferase
MRTREPFVVAVILNWNRAADTVACLESLGSLTYGNQQAIVVDNGSSDGSAERIRAAVPGVELLSGEVNLGFAGGANLGIERALALGAEYVLLLNNDTVAAPESLTLLVDACACDEAVGVSVPKITYHEDPERIWSAGARWRSFPPRVTMIGFGRRDGPAYDKPGDLEYATGCAMLVRRRVFEVAGAFDPAYFMYQEDYDFCRRVREAGYRIAYAPAARIEHKVSQGLGEGSPQKWYLWSKSAARFYLKNVSAPALACFLAWVAVREACKGRTAFLRPLLRGVRDGIQARGE